jgi:hypothetical protein
VNRIHPKVDELGGAYIEGWKQSTGGRRQPFLQQFQIQERSWPWACNLRPFWLNKRTYQGMFSPTTTIKPKDSSNHGLILTICRVKTLGKAVGLANRSFFFSAL